MKVFLVFLVSLFMIQKKITCQSNVDKMDGAFDLCLKEYDITVNEIYSTQVNLTCFNSCIAVKAGIIKDRKFDLEKYAKYLLDVEDSRAVQDELKAYKFCGENLPDLTDACEQYLHLQKCVDQQLFPNENKN
ncbi:uncharacterized protein LOC127286951 [Leptopilina boulardi]|uniref:uncharacterized protein LOC127286951 n=1 Tax=Leptopilina boulardi TaxID=63433 RepID=UPI0021F56997|nr:uncharacterized protein LOC127286951 [Leptopilina boulardi]